jgi:hypothetical protein
MQLQTTAARAEYRTSHIPLIMEVNIHHLLISRISRIISQMQHAAVIVAK